MTTEREWTQDEIDEQMFVDDEDDELAAWEACGRWENGRLVTQCSLAGTEECDWECPVGLPHRKKRKCS